MPIRVPLLPTSWDIVMVMTEEEVARVSDDDDNKDNNDDNERCVDGGERGYVFACCHHCHQ